MVQDEKGHKCAFNTKGAAGFKPCMLCKNVVSGPVASFVSDGYTQHVALAEPHTFDLMSTAEFFSIVDLLEQSAGTKRRRRTRTASAWAASITVAVGVLVAIAISSSGVSSSLYAAAVWSRYIILSHKHVRIK